MTIVGEIQAKTLAGQAYERGGNNRQARAQYLAAIALGKSAEQPEEVIRLAYAHQQLGRLIARLTVATTAKRTAERSRKVTARDEFAKALGLYERALEHSFVPGFSYNALESEDSSRLYAGLCRCSGLLGNLAVLEASALPANERGLLTQQASARFMQSYDYALQAAADLEGNTLALWATLNAARGARILGMDEAQRDWFNMAQQIWLDAHATGNIRLSIVASGAIRSFEAALDSAESSMQSLVTEFDPPPQ